MKRTLILLILGLGCLRGRTQIENLKPTATPNVASLGVYGQIPVDYFTGTPQISIPLYTYKSRDISVPIGISYHSGNYKPSDHPGIVGLGWSLQAGGMITRIQRDLPDELIDVQCGPAVNRGFFYNYNALVYSTWNSLSTEVSAAQQYEAEVQLPNACGSHNRVDYAPDEFQFNFLGMSGSLVMGQDGQWHQKGKGSENFSVATEIGPYAVWEPNFNTSIATKNYPSLIRNCLTRFVLTAGDGTKYYFGTDPATTTNGWNSSFMVQYFSSPDSNAVEFARVGSGYGNGSRGARDGGTVPMTWLLTKILSPTGDSVVFRYTRDGPQVIVSTTAAFGSYTNCSSCNPQIGFTCGAGDVVSILDGSTLSSITGANGSVQLTKSQANILDYTLLGNIGSPQDIGWGDNGTQNGLYFAYGVEVFQGYSQSSGPGVKSVFMELDNLRVLDNFGNPVKSYAFNYNKSATNRLWLNSVTETGADGSTLPPYSFTYNNTAALNNIPYNTVEVDHWGYYNGVDPFTGLFTNVAYEPTHTDPSTGQTTTFYAQSSNYLNNTNAFNSAFNATYTANRNPVDGPLEYGILTQINYPTGGNTQFVWEPNKYSKFLTGTANSNNTMTFSVQDAGADFSGPGVRIHQIVDQAGYNAPAVTKTYTYFRDFVNNNYASSGVLNSAQPSYCDEYVGANFTYRDWSSQDVNATHYTDGSPLTYTNVQEQNSDGSYKTFTYSNQDNGYQDWAPSNYDIWGFPSLSPVVQSVSLTSMELERGLLLKENSYGVGSVLLESKIHQYNNAPGRFQDSINMYMYTKKFSLNGASLSFDDGGFLSVGTSGTLYYGDILCALSIHYYYPYLQSDTVIQYDQNGANPMTVVTNYTYDYYRNKKTESFTSSKNEPVLKSYNYAADPITGLSSSAQTAQYALYNAGMVGIPLEQVETRSGTQTAHWRMDYQSYPSGGTLLVPGQSYKASYTASPEPLTQYVNFDNLGNVNEYITRDGLTTCYDWGYNQSYPVVKITNATNTLHSYPVTTNSTGGSSVTWAANDFTSRTATFNVQAAGSIVLSGGFESNPGTETYTFYWTLTGPGTNQSGQFCIAGPQGSCPSGTVSTANVTVGGYGQYTLTVSPQSNYNNVGLFFSYSFPVQTTTITTAGSKNYFYDGFEENNNIAVVSGSAHTGDMYWGGSTYTPGFTPPDNGSYTIEWWGLQSGSWVYHTQGYTSGMSISGPVDDVRIFPVGAMMSTYTYRPLLGMTSEIDARGYTSYYTYDAFSRLSAELDKDRNVLKRYCYNYTGQAGSCPVYTTPPMESLNVSNTTNQTNVLTFTNQATNSVVSYMIGAGVHQTFHLPAGTYGVTMGPVSPTASYPINYNINGLPQTYYGMVGYSNVGITGASTVTIAPPAEENISVSNTTTEAMTLAFVYNPGSYSYTYTFSVPAGYSGVIGTVPTGTYGVTMGPVSPASSYPVNYAINGMPQTYFATVGYVGVGITGSSTVTMAPPAQENVYVTNSSSEAMTLSFVYNPGSYSYTYTFNVAAYGIGPVGSIPTGTYVLTVGPVSPNSNYPLVYNVNGSVQNNYSSVTYSGLSVTSQVTVNMGPPPPLPVYVTNSTSDYITVQYTNTSTNQVYTFTSNPRTGSTLVGTIPPGTYGLTMGPTNPTTSYPIVYTDNGAPQTYYATVGYGSTALSGTQTLTVSTPPAEPIVVTNTSNKTVTLTFTNAWGYAQNFTSYPGNSNTTVGSVYAGTYNVLMAPSNYSPSYPIQWKIYTSTQVYYATVLFGSVPVNSSCPINISFY